MATLLEPAVRFGVVVVAAILWVAKGYALSVHRGEKKFKVVMALKTLVIGAVGGVVAFALGNGTSGEALAMAMAFAVPLVDNVWNQFSSTWKGLEELDTVERFEKAANDLVSEYGDEAAEKMDETRREVTGQSPTDPPMSGLADAATSASEATNGLSDSMESTSSESRGDSAENAKQAADESVEKTQAAVREGRGMDDVASGEDHGAEQTETLPEGEPPAGTDTDSEKVPDPNAGKAPTERVNEKVAAVPDTHAGYQVLRAVAAHIPSVNGNGSRSDIERELRGEPPATVLDAFEAVEAEARGTKQDGEST